jgi:hypothetical protein
MFSMMRILGICLVALGLGLPEAMRAETQDWRERVQVLYDPMSRSVERQKVRVFDMFPGQNLYFTWEPAPGNAVPIDPATAQAQGEGRLIWRAQGMPDYDSRAIYAIFEGRLTHGKAEGEGRIEIRSGESYEGTWVAGLREGQGYLRKTDGTHYEGAFKAGLPHGKGRHTARDGTVFIGLFQRGLRHGEAMIRLPGGTEYRSVWAEGTEVESERPDILLDAMTGGLLRAQAGDQASRATLSPVIDMRRSSFEALHYTAQPMDGALGIYPGNRDIIDGWNLTARIEPWSWLSTYEEFWAAESNNAYMHFSLETQDGQPVEIRDVWLEVEESLTERKPLLEVRQMQGCIGHRPHFGLLNHGWGTVENATLRYRFVPLEAAENPELINRGTQMFEARIGAFSDAQVIEVNDALPQLGVNSGALATNRLRCNIADPFDHASCVAQIRENPAFGQLSSLIGIIDNYAAVGIAGELEFGWTDASGARHSATQPLSARVSLAWIDGVGMAEMGASYEEFVDSPRHMMVEFPLDRRNYTFGLDYRGERRAARVEIPLKLRSSAASIHTFRGAVRFGDGSVRYSQPVRLFYIQPRMWLDEAIFDRYEPQECFQFEY